MYQKSKPKVVVILGPTTSGKSDLAVAVARQFHGEVVSADSRQVYRELDIGSGKVPRDNAQVKSKKLKVENNPAAYLHKGIVHHLLDVTSPRRVFSVARYQKLGRTAIRRILKNGHLPVVAGGSGLYIDALISNRTFPAVPPNKELRRILEKQTAAALFKKLERLDPKRAASIDRHNRRRLVRALEIVLTTNQPVPRITPGTPLYDVLKIGLRLPGTVLRARIHRRLTERLSNGLVDEVKNLHASGLSWQRLDELGLEYRYVSRYLRSLWTYPEMVATLEKEIWHYAKRQMTWFKRDKDIHWLDQPAQTKTLIRNFIRP